MRKSWKFCAVEFIIYPNFLKIKTARSLFKGDVKVALNCAEFKEIIHLHHIPCLLPLPLPIAR
jgi:hypothetical protein